jgi:hypothetical protein
MTEPTPETLEKIKAECEKLGVEFVGVENGRIVVKEKDYISGPPMNVFTPFFTVEENPVAREAPEPNWHVVRHNRRVRYGKRPKFK